MADGVTLHISRRAIRAAGMVAAAVVIAGGAFALGHFTAPSVTAGHRPLATRTGTRATFFPASPPSPPTTVALPEVASCAGPDSPPVLRPALIGFGCAGLNSGVRNITWTSWGSEAAYGIGTLYEDNCVPDCAAGSDAIYPNTRIELDLPVTFDGALVFSQILVTPPPGASPLYNPSQTGSEGGGWGAGEP